MAFLDDNYLLTGDTAARLYAACADLPIIDPHNHADVEEIWRNTNYTDIWEVEAATDHYVWELLRKRGVPERLVTGDATNQEKWLAMAEVFPDLAGNPTYEWIHLDLKRRFGITELLSAETGQSIWDETQKQLQTDRMRPQQLLDDMNVEHICSTDDPADSLDFHRKLADSPVAGRVHPTFRPDKAMNIFKPDWRDYVDKLADCVGTSIASVADLVDALQERHDYFGENGCVASDHGVEVPYAFQVDEAEADRVFRKAYKGDSLSEEEIISYMSYLLNETAEMDAQKGWIFQLHLGCVRDIRHILAQNLGPDSGGDISDHMIDIVAPFTPLLNRFDGRLKTVIYTLDPNQQTTVATICRCFGENVSLGAAWWYNDSPIGMRRQLEYIGSVDVLRNFAGMVSDSRKLLSYGSRNEMFRRTLCDVVGSMVDNGQIPLAITEDLVQYLSYARPKELFRL